MKTIFAHRGLSNANPENTMLAFDALIGTNVKWFETDLGITADKHVVIMHDDYLDRTTNGSGLITEAQFADVEKLNASRWFDPKLPAQKLPTLDDLVDFINRSKLNVNIELKPVIAHNADELADEVVHQLAEALKKVNSTSEVVVSSFNPIMLLKFKELCPDVKRACLYTKYTIDEDFNLTMQAVGAKAINLDVDGLTKEKVQMYKSYGYEVNVWTVDSYFKANKLFNWGVDGIFTNVADKMVERFN